MNPHPSDHPSRHSCEDPSADTKDIWKKPVERAGTGVEQARQMPSFARDTTSAAIIRHAEDDWQGILREWLNATLMRACEQVKWIDEISSRGVSVRSSSSGISTIYWNRPFACVYGGCGAGHSRG